MLNLTTFGSVVTFSCNHGYYLAGNKSASCQANKEWRSISAKCIRKFYTVLTYSRYAGFRHSTYSTASTLWHACQYQTLHSNYVRILFSIAFCDPPGEVSNGRLEGIGNKQIDVGEKVKYTCNNGYELSNKKDNIRTCQLNRKWSGKAPTCQR